MFFIRKVMISLSIIGIISFSYVSSETLYQKNDCRTKIEEIDREIQYLEDLKIGLEGRAVRYENQAQRLQFEQELIMEAKRFWNMAEQNRKAAAELEQKIQEKKAERQKILEKECKSLSSSIMEDNSKEADSDESNALSSTKEDSAKEAISDEVIKIKIDESSLKE